MTNLNVNSRYIFRSLACMLIAIATGWTAVSCATPAPPTPAALSVSNRSTATPTVASTNTAVPTPTATPNDSPTLDHSPTPGPSPTTSNTFTPTPTPSDTPTPTATPTSKPQIIPTAAMDSQGFMREGEPTPPTPIPTPVPTFEVPRNVTNILLLGNDNPLGGETTRTDTMIIVSIDHSEPAASLLSLPRDLYVYIPDWTMNRLNTALQHGSAVGYPGGGVGLLKQTILYNFGIPIHYYARVDFEGFEDIVDTIGGIDVAVSCRLEDWRLKSPNLDPLDEDNWERFELEPGVHHMDGDLALWYARSRLSTNDFDRGRRQQQLLRAMFTQGVDLGLVSQVPTLWQAFQDTVETDLDIGRMLQLATLAPKIRENGLQHLYLAGATQSWAIPESGANVQLPIWEGDGMMEETFYRLFHPPTLNRAGRRPITVEIVNATSDPDMTALAADNLAYYGLVPIIGEFRSEKNEQTQVRYFKPNFKNAYEWLVSWVFDVRISEIELVDEPGDYPYNYQVILGEDYNPCRPQLYAPQEFLSNDD